MMKLTNEMKQGGGEVGFLGRIISGGGFMQEWKHLGPGGYL